MKEKKQALKWGVYSRASREGVGGGGGDRYRAGPENTATGRAVIAEKGGMSPCNQTSL